MVANADISKRRTRNSPIRCSPAGIPSSQGSRLSGQPGLATIYPWHPVTSSLLHHHHLHPRFGRAGVSRLGDAAPHRSTCSVHFPCPPILASSSSGINRLSSKLSNEERFIIYYCHLESGAKSNTIQSTQAKQAKPSQSRFLPFTMVRDARCLGNPCFTQGKLPPQNSAPAQDAQKSAVNLLKHTILALMKTTNIAKTLRKRVKR
ncbi:hypothetical protein J3F84DRAFT_71539 [Trichoderma pleuroticola]